MSAVVVTITVETASEVGLDELSVELVVDSILLELDELSVVLDVVEELGVDITVVESPVSRGSRELVDGKDVVGRVVVELRLSVGGSVVVDAPVGSDTVTPPLPVVGVPAPVVPGPWRLWKRSS